MLNSGCYFCLMKEEQEKILKYIGELYARRRQERKEGKLDSTPEHDDIVKAGKRLRSIREKHQISLTQLAAATGLTENYIASIELGEADPYMTEIYDLTKALGIQLSDLFDKP